jgi:formylglycine-generating enzyme required for sulfatase activity
MPVGQKAANGFGLFDVYGNVWEWCWDRYHEEYYGSSPVDDPTGPTNGTFRSLRGGAWSYHLDSCRSANRNGLPSDYRFAILGFRVTVALEDD